MGHRSREAVTERERERDTERERETETEREREREKAKKTIKSKHTHTHKYWILCSIFAPSEKLCIAQQFETAWASTPNSNV